MGDRTSIEWTDATWNPTTGCDKVSPGCDNCYAMTLAKRLKTMGSPRYQLDGDRKRPGVMRSVLSNPTFKLMVNAARMERGVSVLPDSRRQDGTYAWPLPNVWLGTSVEDQKRADLRVPQLLETPAAVRFLSMEPLLGPVSFRWAPWAPLMNAAHLDGLKGIDWVIVGGEHFARRYQAGVAHMTRVGKKAAGRDLDRRTWDEFPEVEPCRD